MVSYSVQNTELPFLGLLLALPDEVVDSGEAEVVRYNLPAHVACVLRQMTVNSNQQHFTPCQATVMYAHHAVADQFQGWSSGRVRGRLAGRLLLAVVHWPALQQYAVVLKLAQHVVDHFVNQQYPRRIEAALAKSRQLRVLSHKRPLSLPTCSYRHSDRQDGKGHCIANCALGRSILAPHRDASCQQRIATLHRL